MSAIAYAQLLRRYLASHLSAIELRDRFNEAFQAEPRDMDPDLFFILNPLWASLEAYSPRISVGQENPVLISEATLRRDTETALLELRRYDQTLAQNRSAGG